MSNSKPGKQAIAIVWFKRDLRLTDHEPLALAQAQGLPILLVYCFEPSVMHNDDSDVRHWRFVYQSLQDMQSKLDGINTRIHVFHQEVLAVFETLQQQYAIKAIFSHQEIGNKITYDRDLAVKQFCSNHDIAWTESRHNGVIRKLKSRKEWQQRWKETMLQPANTIDLQQLNTLLLDSNF
jgi:deoxyribodipyrimidine photo-lyase